MKSVGEAMGIGRTFKESLQKAIRSLEQDRAGLNGDGKDPAGSSAELLDRAARPTPDRIFQVEAAPRLGATRDSVTPRTGIDPWFLGPIEENSAIKQAPSMKG